jgi:hypothetical protein
MYKNEELTNLQKAQEELKEYFDTKMSEIIKKMEQIKQTGKSRFYIPTNGETYFYVYISGTGEFSISSVTAESIKEAYYKRSVKGELLFQTKEGAEEYKEVLKIKARILRIADKFPVDWEDDEQKKYCFLYDFEDKCVRETDRCFSFHRGVIYGSKGFCEAVRKEIPEKTLIEYYSYTKGV